MYASFVRELRALMRAPYALIHVETHEEDRALELIYALASADERPMWQWSPVTGFDGQPGGGDIERAIATVMAAEVPGVFALKDAAPYIVESPLMRRRLRELERNCAAAGKTVIFLGAQDIMGDELTKEVTRVSMPLPHREAVRAECDAVFPAAEFSEQEREALTNGALGLTLRESRRAFHRVRTQHREALERNARFDIEASILREKQRLIGASDALEFHPMREGIKDVGGLGELKRWLGERAAAFSTRARDFGLPAPKGLLLVGVQGCGKSLTAKVVAKHWGLPLLRLDLGRVFDGRRAPEETLRDALKTSEAMAPCVLWLDEIEKGFGADQSGRATRVLGSMLTWLQEKTSPVFMVATANQVHALPPELLRKGRFDEIFFVDLPEVHERKQILEIHLRRRRRVIPDEELEALAATCELFSGSELEEVVVSGLYVAFSEERDLTGQDLVWAAKSTVPLFKTYEEDIKALREWASGRARPASRKRRVIDYFSG